MFFFFFLDRHHRAQIHHLSWLQCSPSHPHLHRRSANYSKLLLGLHISYLVISFFNYLITRAKLVEFSPQALICLVDKKTGEKSKTRPRFVKQDQVCIARLRAAGVICLETFKDFPQMGRFTLRDEGKDTVQA